MVRRMINSIHPQPIVPLDDRFDYTFGRQCDAMDSFRLFNEEDTRDLVGDESDDYSISVWRFSSELRDRLHSRGHIPPTGMINTEQEFSDPVTNDLFKEEYRALYAIDSFSSFTQSNCWFHDATRECVRELFADNPDRKDEPWYPPTPPTPGKPEDTGTDKGDKCVDKDDHGEKDKDKTINDGDNSSNGDDGDNEGNGDNNSKD